MGQMLLPFLNAIQDAVPGRSTATPPPPSQSQYLQQQRKDGVTAEHLQAAMTGLGLPQQQQAAPSAAATSRTPAGEEDDEERERIKSNSDLAASQVLNPMVAPRAGMVMFSSLAQFQDFINRPVSQTTAYRTISFALYLFFCSRYQTHMQTETLFCRSHIFALFLPFPSVPFSVSSFQE